MSSENIKLRFCLLLLLVGMVASVPAFAGSAVIGSVAGSMNATVGGQALLPNSTIFSGDSLEVKDGAAVVAVTGGSRIVFGRETVASFLRDANEVTVLLGQGNVSMYHPDGTTALRVKAGDVSIVPASGFRTLGEVAITSGALVVTAKEGLLRVEGNGPAVEVAKGKTITVLTKAAGAPQGGAAKAAKAGGAARVGSSTALGVTNVALSGIATVLAGVAMKRAGDARTDAIAATGAAKQADTDAIAAKASADTADADALAAGAAANSVGCALNGLAIDSGLVDVSPYTPPSGSTCP